MILPRNYNDLDASQRRLTRLEYIKVQNGLCYYCKAPLNGPATEAILRKPVKPKYYPKGFFENPIHLHHNHVTGFTIGAVHAYCNAVLWEYHGE